MGGSYEVQGPLLDVRNQTYLTNLNLNDILRDRRRYDGTLCDGLPDPRRKGLVDDACQLGRHENSEPGRELRHQRGHAQLPTGVSDNKLNVITNLLHYEQTLPLFIVDANLSHAYSENHDPNDVALNFVQQSDGVAGPAYQRLDPRLIPGLAVNHPAQAKLNSLSASNSFSRDRTISGSLDLLSPVRVSDNFSGSVKFGGKIQYRQRSYDYEQSDGALLVSGGALRQHILDALPWMKQLVPTGVAPLPMTLFTDGVFSYGRFLGGDYSMVSPLNVSLIQPVIDIARQYGSLEAWSYNSMASITNDYSGFEHQDAAYAMITADLGQDITLVGGVRYQRLETSYTAPRGIQSNGSHYSYTYRDTTINESQGSWLPMAHIMYRPLAWLQVRFAYTNTLAYPDYSAITPRINLGFSAEQWNNYALKQSHSENFDLVVSILDNGIGLFSVDGFSKKIDNFILPVNRYVIDPAQYPGPPDAVVPDAISTSINDPFVVNLLGIEFDWQTHFWYLPSALSGLVMSVNYTHIFSKAKYSLTTVTTTYSPDPPYVIKTYDDTYYEDRLIDQPDDIVNLALGYDYEGFSTRVSMLYQANIFKADNFWPDLRVQTSKYLRWDLSVKQALPWFGLQAFFDLNNLNNARDLDVVAGSGFPTAQQYYGLTADIGLRIRL